MSNQSLHITIRQVVEKHGQEILSDLRLMYILSDYGAFDKLSNEHAIVKDLQTKGYGQLLLNCKNNPDTDWQTEAGVFIDDFLADGQAVHGLMSLCEQRKAKVVGVGIAIEKGFQPGGEELRKAGVHLKSLAIVDAIEDGKIRLREKD